MMAMKRQRRGFILMIAVMAISLVGVAVLVLAEGAKTILFQADRAYLEAVEQNLMAGALAWSRQNAHNLTGEQGKVVELDTGNMQLRDSSLTVRVETVTDRAIDVQVSTSCKKGRQTLSSSRKYRIALPERIENSKSRI